jgi:hypothetical protein
MGIGVSWPKERRIGPWHDIQSEKEGRRNEETPRKRRLGSESGAKNTTGMSERLQVLLEADELREVRRAASLARVSFAEWVRAAARHAFPVGEMRSSRLWRRFSASSTRSIRSTSKRYYGRATLFSPIRASRHATPCMPR